MNRRQRRAARHRGPVEPRKLANVIACPDCTADVSVIEVAPGEYHGIVEHDDTCPWFAAFKRDGGIGVRLA